jgi:hypothetical protein
VTVFDPPPLLKRTENLFHRYDVQIKSEPLGNQLSVIAKWGHIAYLYESEKCCAGFIGR